MNLIWDNWHIELSSICTLKCPRCPRTEVQESLLNRQLTLDFFKAQIGNDIIKQIKKITFCGNDGDPIYCRDFIEICRWIKTTNPTVNLTIVTNGSYKPTIFWHDLAKILNQHDEVRWSLDGWDQQSNEQYRINCNWASIINGIQEFRAHNKETYTVWATIAFKFNEDYFNKQQQLAKAYEFDLFQITKSSKFGEKYLPTHANTSPDPLAPTRSDLIANNLRYGRIYTHLTSRTRPDSLLKPVFIQRADYLNKHTTYSGICLIGNKGVFLTSQGEFYPCCWTANRYKHNQYWHELAQTKFNLHNRSTKEILDDPFWQTEFLKFDQFECRVKCTKENLTDTFHITEF